jgi:hypothetical protein
MYKQNFEFRHTAPPFSLWGHKSWAPTEGTRTQQRKLVEIYHSQIFSTKEDRDRNHIYTI